MFVIRPCWVRAPLTSYSTARSQAARGERRLSARSVMADSSAAGVGALVLSNQTGIRKAEVAIVPDDNMIQDLDPHDLSGEDQLFGNRLVGGTRSGIARRVVVGNDEGRGMVAIGQLHDLAGIDGTFRERAFTRRANVDDLVLAVQQQHPKDLPLEIAHLWQEKGMDIL